MMRDIETITIPIAIKTKMLYFFYGTNYYSLGNIISFIFYF